MHWSKTKNRNRIADKIRQSKIGSKNHQWIEKNPSYGSVHTWLWKNFKKKKCYRCGTKSHLEWALKKGKTHSHSTDNYLVLCSSCHKKYDYTDERKKKLSESLKGREITWITNPNRNINGQFMKKS